MQYRPGSGRRPDLSVSQLQYRRRAGRYDLELAPFEPYREQADRVLAAVDAAREVARGHEALLVSHQLPIWVTRLAAEKRHLWHDPRRRQCSLASITSLHFDDDTLVGLGYIEPAAVLLDGAATVAGA